jgi:hypothetical protein
MSMGGEFDKYESRIDRFLIEGEAGRLAQAAKEAIGHKSLFKRLFERVRPPRQDPSAIPETFRGSDSYPGR